VDCRKIHTSARGEGKWAVDQARFSLEAGQTDWGNMSGWRMGVEWITVPQRLAHVIPNIKMGDVNP
jgi:hypothetical protein